MNVFSTIPDIRKQRWAEPLATWGLVPTMGFLHEGHLSLVRRARQENEKVGVSIFINPIQFNDPNDLANYPYDLDRDLELLENERVDLVWTPTPDIVYPSDYQTFVEVEKVTRRLEGEARPGHFRGVTTVVAKLFNIFQPNRAYFGQKDIQQVIVIKRMVRDLNFNLEIITCPTIREADGLALSSRNANLSPAARQQARCLYQALVTAKSAFEAGERDAEQLRATMLNRVNSFEMASVDYVSVAHPDTLEELEAVEEQALLSLAVFIDNVRLIDNITVGSKNNYESEEEKDSS